MPLVFDAKAHKYILDGMVIKSVTEILRDAGIYGDYHFAEAHHKYRGHAVHAGCAIIDAGGTPRIAAPPHLEHVAEEVRNGYWPAYARFKERTSFQGAIWECPFIHRRLGYGGTFDAVGVMGPDVVLLDCKSGALPDMVPVQLAAYELLLREGEPVNPDHPGLDWLMETISAGVALKHRAVRLEKNGTDTLFSETRKRESYDLPKWMAAWKAAASLANLKASYGQDHKPQGGARNGSN